MTHHSLTRSLAHSLTHSLTHPLTHPFTHPLTHPLTLQPADDDLDTPIPPARCSVFAIAYHNVGVENEFLKNYKQAVDAYEKGLDLGEEHLGSQHFVCITLRNSLNAVRSTARKAKKGSSTARSSGRTPF